MLVVYGTADRLVLNLQAEVLVEAMEKAGAPFYFHTVVGGGHNPYFGLTFNAAAGNFDAGGGGIGLFEDRAVEPLIFAFFRHYLWEGRKELFKGSSLAFLYGPVCCGAEWALIGHSHRQEPPRRSHAAASPVGDSQTPGLADVHWPWAPVDRITRRNADRITQKE
jgi:hypothetical protein